MIRRQLFAWMQAISPDDRPDGPRWVEFWSFFHLLSGGALRSISRSPVLPVVLHTAFELWENSAGGIRAARWLESIAFGHMKYRGDSLINSVFDLFFHLAGWYLVHRRDGKLGARFVAECVAIVIAAHLADYAWQGPRKPAPLPEQTR